MFEGLSSLHERGVTHRDLKPSNTILRIDGAGSSSRGFGVRGSDDVDEEDETENRGGESNALAQRVEQQSAREGIANRLRALAAPGSSAGGGGDGADGDGPHNGAGDGGGQAGGSGGQSRAGAGPTPSVRLADFGSAVDAEVLQRRVGLYPNGPSVDEETEGYQPPEATIGGEPYDMHVPASYDLWSMGVLILELLLGTPHVLQLSARAEAALRVRFADQPASVLAKLLRANAYAEHCILPPKEPSTTPKSDSGRAGGQTDDGKQPTRGPLATSSETTPSRRERGGEPSSVGSDPGLGRRSSARTGGLGRACGRAQFIAAIERADPLAKLGRGVAGTRLDVDLLDLAWRLLKWSPHERISAADALSHPALQPTAARAASATGVGTSIAMRSTSYGSTSTSSSRLGRALDWLLSPPTDTSQELAPSPPAATRPSGTKRPRDQLWPMECPVMPLD